jgi:FtsP/CotA-like multicopper oxidase with cupredoxin domain
LRLRVINASPRSVTALKFDNQDVRIIAIDGYPAEPFVARAGTLVLSPGTRIDAMIDASGAPGSFSPILLHDGLRPQRIGRIAISSDAPLRDQPLPPTAPLSSDGLPAKLDLQGALRVSLALDSRDWIAPAPMLRHAPAAFRVARGRTVSLALANTATQPIAFTLRGHPFRLLDKLDDGWKPFWLTTLTVEPGATQRIAFQAVHRGAWGLEATATNWAAPLGMRWYAVD